MVRLRLMPKVGSLPVTTRTVEHLRERACQDGPIEALTPRPSSRVYERKLDGKGEARLVSPGLLRLRRPS